MNVRITVSLPEYLVEQANTAVRTGRARSVSAWVATALEKVPARESALDVLDEWLADAAPLTEAEEAWIEEAHAAVDRAAKRSTAR